MSETATVNTPHYKSESILDVIGSTVAAAMTAVNSSSVLDITSTAQPIFDVVNSESVLDVVSSAQQSAVAVIVSGSVLDFVLTSTQSPVGAVSSTSTLDLLSEVTVFPGVPAVGASVLDFNLRQSRHRLWRSRHSQSWTSHLRAQSRHRSLRLG